MRARQRLPIAVTAAAFNAAAVLFAVTATATASPNGAEWQTADNPAGCGACHPGSPDPENSAALTLLGLPARAEAGQTYTLNVVLDDPELKLGGFLLSVTANDSPAGRFVAVDDTVEANGALVRSTRIGSRPEHAGHSEWQLQWIAPDGVTTPLEFSLWGNAGNDDLSPLGDRLHHRVWQLPTAP